jgi:predicted  nucleic acid-binding Zn-ribbon protein
MNSRQRRYYEDRLDKLQDKVEQKESEIAEINEEIEGILNAIGQADMDDLNRQYERDCR